MTEIFELVDDYLIAYDGDSFDLYKQSDKRSLVNVANYLIDENEELKEDLKELANEHDKTLEELYQFIRSYFNYSNTYNIESGDVE